MTVKNLVETLTLGAVSAARHPLGTTARAVGLVKGAAEAGIGLVRGGHADVTEAPPAHPEHEDAARKAGERADQAPDQPAVPEQRASEPEDVDARPEFGPDAANLPPMREPLPAAPQRAPEDLNPAFATEPTAASRDSEHGGPPAGREEIDGYVEEIHVEPDVDVETPVGTTGASAGMNPDTAEADLQQPDTEPLIDPSLAKQVASEAEVMQKGADLDKA